MDRWTIRSVADDI